MKIAEVTGTCQYEGCSKEAEEIACGRERGLGCFCEDHARIVTDEGNPEYTVGCPNCGCQFGVN